MYGSDELEEVDFDTFALCDYESGVNGEGHSGWFFNKESTGGKEAINRILLALEKTLSAPMYDNLKKAFHSYGTDSEDEVCEAADDFFYEHEQEIIEYLQGIANHLEL